MAGASLSEMGDQFSDYLTGYREWEAVQAAITAAVYGALRRMCVDDEYRDQGLVNPHAPAKGAPNDVHA